MKSILVTGISGFLGGRIGLMLLERGYKVHGSVRNAAKARAVREVFIAHGANLSHLTLHELDLLDDRGWSQAAAATDATIHVASPFLIRMPKDKNELIKPAVDGTERALQAALAANHQRIVLTSSLAAIDGGRNYDCTLTENDWSNLDSPFINAYIASKTLAERKAWSIMKQAGNSDRLAVINPGAIFGPLLDTDPGTSAEIILNMLNGAMPIVPNIILSCVDVRDVAAAHIAALTTLNAAGKRHILCGDNLSLFEIANLLRRAFPQYTARLPRSAMPNWLAKVAALFDKSLRDNRPFLGVRKRFDAARGTALVGKPLIPANESIIASAQSMIDFGMV